MREERIKHEQRRSEDKAKREAMKARQKATTPPENTNGTNGA